MEDGLFLQDEFPKLLKDSVVESRVHDDHPDPKIRQAVKDLRARYSKKGDIARPIYVMVDPATGKSLARKRGVFSEKQLRDFIGLRGNYKPKAKANN